jgi:hypothetical protein
MEDKFLESARIIVEQNGSCCGINCKICPYGTAYKVCTLSYENRPKEKIEWFKNYIKQNEVKQMTPIFENEEQFKIACKDIFKIDVSDKDIFEAKQKGYIKKSIVDEAIEMYKEYCLADKNDLLYGTMYEAIQYLLDKNK